MNLMVGRRIDVAMEREVATPVFLAERPWRWMGGFGVLVGVLLLLKRHHKL